MFLNLVLCEHCQYSSSRKHVKSETKKQGFPRRVAHYQPSPTALDTWTILSPTGYTPLHAVQADTRSGHRRIHRRPVQVGRPHAHTVRRRKPRQTVRHDHALPVDGVGETVPLPEPVREREPVLPDHVPNIGRYGLHGVGSPQGAEAE